jgi:6-phosphogluconolactonase
MIMKHFKKISVIVISMFVFAACQKAVSPIVPDANNENDAIGNVASTNSSDEFARDGGGGGKHVYTLSNQISGNAVLDYTRASDGKLTYNTSYSTGGTGTGGGLGNQYAIILGEGEDDEEDDSNVLLAVNAGSNSISSFKVTENGLALKSTVSSGGMRPVSITQHDDIVFVLNAGGMGNISGFKLGNNKMLTAIVNSTRPLSSNASAAAEVAFVNNGKVLVVTERATNKIITYTVSENGIPGAMHSITSVNTTPFGFDAGNNGNIFVSEAAGGAPGASTLSSYHVSNDGTITLVDGPNGAGQRAACWVVITDNGKYAYTTNTASNNLSNYNVNKNTASISVNTAIAATTDMGPIDAALSNNSKYLYILNGGSHTIGVYAVASNGALSALQTVMGVPIGSTGLAAR